MVDSNDYRIFIVYYGLGMQELRVSGIGNPYPVGYVDGTNLYEYVKSRPPYRLERRRNSPRLRCLN